MQSQVLDGGLVSPLIGEILHRASIDTALRLRIRDAHDLVMDRALLAVRQHHTVVERYFLADRVGLEQRPDSRAVGCANVLEQARNPEMHLVVEAQRGSRFI